jgi:hypothetical protein
MNSDSIIGFFIGIAFTCIVLAILNYPEDVNDVKLCTIKLNDDNKYSSYLTGPCT